jgi:cell division protease FtsH
MPWSPNTACHLGHFAYKPTEDTFWQRPYSEETARRIDAEVQRLIQDAYERARAVLQEHYDHLRQLAERLLAKEVLYQEEIEEVLGPRPFGYGALEKLKAPSG